MNKEYYTKPTIDVLELSDDLILASGCVDISGCTSQSCDDICSSHCSTPCDPQCVDFNCPDHLCDPDCNSYSH